MYKGKAILTFEKLKKNMLLKDDICISHVETDHSNNTVIIYFYSKEEIKGVTHKHIEGMQINCANLTEAQDDLKANIFSKIYELTTLVNKL